MRRRCDVPSEAPLGQQMTPTTDSTLAYYEGLRIDEDGVVVEIDGLPDSLRPTEADAEAAVQVSEADADWLLKRFFKVDAAILADDTRRKAETKAIEANLKPTINRLKRTRDWLEASFGERLREYLVAVLSVRNAGKAEDKWQRSIKLAHGSLNLVADKSGSVAVPEDIRAADLRAATAWVQKHYPHAIVMEPVLNLSALTDDDYKRIFGVTKGEITEAEAGWDSPCPLKVTLPGDKFKIRTGVPKS